MVWKDQVNVLDQRRIFRLLAKGPRLDGYLSQLKRADKLDFASWGGFAQNFADRRIPFESPAYSAYLEPRGRRKPAHPHLRRRRLRPLPAGRGHQGRAAHRACSSRTGERACCRKLRRRCKASACRAVRPKPWKTRRWARPAPCRMRFVGAGDSGTVSYAQFKIYLLRVSTMQARGGGLCAGLETEPARRGRGRAAG